MKRLITRTVTTSLLLAAPILTQGGDRVYQYAMADGSTLFTDKRLTHSAPVKVKYYGRPVAHSSCKSIHTQRGEERVKSYMPHIEAMALKYDIEPALIQAVIATESCYDAKAVSRVGAQGLMQLMPATATTLGVKNPFDARQNIAGGVKYLREMLDTFNQDETLALAAYNAGPGAVRKYGGIPPYKETRAYVKKVLTLYRGSI
ncbi:MAG: lytic transglycosylase domain-containing protein [bacterium]